MLGKCPPGVLCIDNVTILSLILVFMAFYIFSKIILQNKSETAPASERVVVHHSSPPSSGRQDVLLNPHAPPLRDDSVFMKGSTDPRGVPINVPTQSVDTEYRQVGILTRQNGQEMILPLMGRPLFTNRDKWQFYTMSEHNPNLKLPLSNGGKSCTGEYGCDNLGNGDSVYVEGYNDAFKVTSYENNVMRYIPFI